MAYTVRGAKAELEWLMRAVERGREVVIIDDEGRKVKLVLVEKARIPRKPRKPGTAPGPVWMADDFNETPEEFAEYID